MYSKFKTAFPNRAIIGHWQVRFPSLFSNFKRESGPQKKKIRDRWVWSLIIEFAGQLSRVGSGQVLMDVMSSETNTIASLKGGTNNDAATMLFIFAMITITTM